MINVDSVFSLFDSRDLNNVGGDRAADVDFRDHPHMLFGFFTKMIDRGDRFNEQLLKSMQGGGKSAEDFYFINKFMIYTRAYEYLDRIDLLKEDHVEYLIEDVKLRVDYQAFILSADKAIRFFTSIEHYEKCAKIKKLQDVVKFFQKKLLF